MNFLNSILIEGTLADDPVSTATNGLYQCSFTIDSGTEAQAIPIVVYNKLARHYSELLHKGRIVRIVGKLRREIESSTDTNTLRLHIVAEHIELRPALLDYGKICHRS
jgi:single-stranded DNA-binding protein